jgi:tripartite-type tricarboxylate transporter receptor subunit TctC
LAESGVTGFEGYNWLGVFAPAGVDPAIVQQINQAINEVLSEPAVARRLSAELVTDPTPKSVAEWRDTVERDFKSWTAVVRAAGVRPEH